MKKHLYTTVAVLLVLGMVGIAAVLTAKNYVAEAHRKVTFTVDKDFVGIRNAIVSGRFEEEVMRINGTTLVSKEWNSVRLSLQRPLQKDRYWEFDGIMSAKISSDKTGIMEMEQQVHVAKDVVDIKTTLLKPLEVGVTDLRERIYLQPAGEGKTDVVLMVYIKLQRYVPSFLKKHAQGEIDREADKMMSDTEVVLKDLTVKYGIIIPIQIK